MNPISPFRFVASTLLLRPPHGIVAGHNVWIDRPREIKVPKHIEIGDNTTVGDGCVLSEFVYINDNGHGIDPTDGPIMNQRLTQKGLINCSAPRISGWLKTWFWSYRQILFGRLRRLWQPVPSLATHMESIFLPIVVGSNEKFDAARNEIERLTTHMRIGSAPQ